MHLIVNAGNHLTFLKIYRASLKLLGDGVDIQQRLKCSGQSRLPDHYHLSVVCVEDRLLAKHHDGTVIGELDAQVKYAMLGLQQDVELDGFILVKSVYDILQKGIKHAVVRMNIEIFGPRKISQMVGQELGESKLYLQKPDSARPGVPYENPHFLNIEGHTPIVEEPISMDLAEQTENNQETFMETISNIYSSLTRDQALTGFQGDSFLKTILLT